MATKNENSKKVNFTHKKVDNAIDVVKSYNNSVKA
jgi:hypothetical protein